MGQVGQESNLQPAVLETQSAVSGDVGWCRPMPPCPALSVAECRRVSLRVVGHWGRYWGSRPFTTAIPPERGSSSMELSCWQLRSSAQMREVPSHLFSVVSPSARTVEHHTAQNRASWSTQSVRATQTVRAIWPK
jgi:hypothetical protein